jgi:nucleotide-binding universal stress UspA family protein
LPEEVNRARLTTEELELQRPGWNLLVPLDGSENANRALPWADTLAAGLQAMTTIVYVRPSPGHPPLGAGATGELTHQVQSTLAGAVQKVRHGQDVRPRSSRATRRR